MSIFRMPSARPIRSLPSHRACILHPVRSGSYGTGHIPSSLGFGWSCGCAGVHALHQWVPSFTTSGWFAGSGEPPTLSLPGWYKTRSRTLDAPCAGQQPTLASLISVIAGCELFFFFLVGLHYTSVLEPGRPRADGIRLNYLPSVAAIGGCPGVPQSQSQFPARCSRHSR